MRAVSRYDSCHMNQALDQDHASRHGVLSDDPVSDPRDDLLSRTRFAAHVADILEQLTAQTPSAVAAIVGPWGAGKTSSLSFVRSNIENSGSFKVIDFNPWMMADLPSLVADFFATLRTALPEGDGTVRQRLATYGRAILPFSAVLNTPYVDLGKLGEIVTERLEANESIDKVREQVAKDLQNLEMPILVMIDDIDRLQPDELMLVLKLVRLVGCLPNVYYLLAYDEMTVLNVILGTTLVANDTTRSREYVEKMVQVKFDLPPLHWISAAKLLDEILSDICARHQITLDEGDEARLASAYRVHLDTHLRQPRQIKRFCAQLETQYPLVRNEVDFVDFVIMTYIRVFHPGLISVLRECKHELTDTMPRFGREPSNAEATESWRKRLHDAGVSTGEIDGVVGILADCFPPIRRYFGSVVAPSRSPHGRGNERGVGSLEYFDRYFHLGVGPDDVSDSIVRDALDELFSEREGEAWQTLVELAPDAAELTIDKLRRFSPMDAETAELLLPVLCDLDKHVPQDAGLLGRPKLVLKWWIGELLAIVAPHDVCGFVRELVDRSSVEYISTALVQANQGAFDEGTPRSSEFVRTCNVVAALVVDALNGETDLSPEGSDDVISLLVNWGVLKPSESPRAWLHDQFKSRRWDVRRFVGFIVPIGMMYDGGAARPCLGTIDFEFVDNLVGVDALIDALDDSGTAWRESIEEPSRDDTSHGARCAHALRAIAERAAASG